MNDWQIIELNIQKNHVHMLIQTNPRDSITHVMHYLKGGSSRMVRKELPELEEFLWGDSFWTDGYFAEKTKTNHDVGVKAPSFMTGILLLIVFPIFIFLGANLGTKSYKAFIPISLLLLLLVDTIFLRGYWIT